MEIYNVLHDKCNLRVYARGKVCDRAIIFLHGGPGSGAKALLDLAAFQAFEDDNLCIHFDQRGSGESYYDVQKGLSITQICEDVECIIKDTADRFHCEQIVLWGGSYGGALACLYMQYIGVGIHGVVLNNPAVVFDRMQGIALYERMRESFLQRLPKDMRNASITSGTPETDLQDESFKSFVYSDHNPSKSLRHICAMSSWFFNTSYQPAFEQMSVPVLLLLGKEDPVCASANTIEAVNEIANPNITLRILSPCGHAIFEDREQDFIDITKSFLQSFL